jgi:STE24 endopeptidase
LDPEEATRAYLARIAPEKKKRSDAYFEGGYWLLLWEFLYGVVVAWLVLRLGWSAGMRNFAERAVGFRPLQTFIYWGQYAVLTALLLFPLTVYRGFYREHEYGLAMQTFAPWFGDRLKELAVAVSSEVSRSSSSTPSFGGRRGPGGSGDR